MTTPIRLVCGLSSLWTVSFCHAAVTFGVSSKSTRKRSTARLHTTVHGLYCGFVNLTCIIPMTRFCSGGFCVRGYGTVYILQACYESDDYRQHCATAPQVISVPDRIENSFWICVSNCVPSEIRYRYASTIVTSRPTISTQKIPSTRLDISTTHNWDMHRRPSDHNTSRVQFSF